MKLPPLNALRAFEAAARHGGFIDAADELCVTRGAISRHVKLLEEQLGVQLFLRNHRGVALTDAGRQFLPVLSEAFQDIAKGAEQISARKQLRIICTPALSIRWLFPRLGEFRERHPEIDVRLTTDFYREYGFKAGEYDLGASVEIWPGRDVDVEVFPLFPTKLSPLCKPALLQGPNALTTPEQLKDFSLLRGRGGRNDWRNWMAEFQLDHLDTDEGEFFPNVDMSIKAAAMGVGVVMGDLMLCREELDLGMLAIPFPDMLCDPPEGGYCLLGDKDCRKNPSIDAFLGWAEEISAEERADLKRRFGGAG